MKGLQYDTIQGKTKQHRLYIIILATVTLLMIIDCVLYYYHCIVLNMFMFCN